MVLTTSAWHDGLSIWEKGIKRLSDNIVDSYRSNLVAWAVALLCAVLSVCAGAAFLPYQALWSDDITQLCGLTLGPVELLWWLSGTDPGRFGILDDRMPPLSYWLGMLWAIFFGDAAATMRWLGVSCVALATVVVHRTAYRAFGAASALLAALLFALSPNVVVQSVGIRAYPLFLLLSAFAVYFLVRLIEETPTAKKKPLISLVVCLVLSVYTHFFGLILAMGLLGSAFVFAKKGRRVPVLWAVGIVGVAAVGLMPFILGATQVNSGAQENLGEVRNVFRLAYRLCGHPSMWISKPITITALVSFALLGMASFWQTKRKIRTHLMVAFALCLGFVVVAVSNFVVIGFDTTKLRYSCWMFPGLSILLASGLASRMTFVRRVTPVVGLVLLACYGYGDYQLAKHGTYFVRAPFNRLEAVIDELTGEDVVVLHDSDSERFSYVSAPYWPIRYVYGEGLAQYRIEGDSGNASGLAARNMADPSVSRDPLALEVDYLLVLNTKYATSNELSQQINFGDVPLGDGHVARALSASPKWRKHEEFLFVSFVTCDVDVYARVTEGASVSSAVFDAVEGPS